MYYGVQYYPEHWRRERWPIDAEMMQRAGVNVVRMGEFAWSALEPREGALNFDWMDEAVALLSERGIKTIMCTPSRTPPPWVFKRYPGVLNVDAEGRVSPYGLRYTIGLAHSEFVELSQRIDRAVVQHYAGNDAIAGWQIDNEIGARNDCYCGRCQALFHDYLRDKYDAIDNLHEAWGHHFWSFSFSDFDEVPVPAYASNPQLALEYRRFLSSLNVEFARWRSELIHALDPGKWVTTNFQSFGANHTDYAQLGKVIDLNGLNHYPSRSPELILDISRGSRGTMLPVEQFTRLEPVDSGPGWMRLWAYRAIAHGACGVNFFRWRCCRWGQEQHRDGLLPHAGQANRRYHELAQMGAELAQVSELLDGTQPDSRVAILLSYETRWAIAAGLRDRNWDVVPDAVRIHNALLQANVPVDAVDPREDLSSYRIVFAPRLFCVDETVADHLRSFVEDGGLLCLTAASGVVDEYNKSYDVPRPGLLRGMAGIEVSDLSPLDAPVPLRSTAIPRLDGSTCFLLADEIHPMTAAAVATYDGGWRKGLPAITLNLHGTGKVLYVGSALEGKAMDALVAYVCGLGGVHGLVDTPEGVRVHQRCNSDARVWFALNYTESRQTISLPGTWRDAFSGAECEAIDIDPTDLRIVVSDRS
jgi:beta-galactosidase